MATIDEELKTRFTSDKHRFIANIIFTSNWYRRNFDEVLKPFNISQQQFNVLRILRGKGDWESMNNIKKVMVDKHPNATRLSDKLLDKGLVERHRCDSDRRVVFLKITEEGMQLLKKLDECDSFLYKHFDNVSEEEAKLVCQVLDKFRD